MEDNIIEIVGNEEAWHGNRGAKTIYRDIVKHYLKEIVNSTIVINLKHGKTVRQEEKNNLKNGACNILFWSVMEKDEKENSYDYYPSKETTLFGKSNYYRHNCYQPNGTGEMIISPEGDIIAEYHKEYNTLFILYDNIHENQHDELEIFENIMQEFQYILLRNKGINIENFKKEQEKRLKEEKEEELINFFLSDEKFKKKQLEENLTNIIRTENETRTRLIRILKEKIITQKQIDNYIKNNKNDLEKIKNIIKEIKNFSKLNNVSVKDNVLSFFTNTLYATIKTGQRYLMGEYEIKVNTQDGKVQFHNLKQENHRRSYWTHNDPHPHVDGYTKMACFGNISSTIADLIAQKEWHILATILINFLEQANIDDIAGKFIVNWDEVNENNEVIKVGENTETPGKIECENCSSMVFEDEIETCEDCDAEICIHCYSYYDKTSSKLCESCYNERIAQENDERIAQENDGRIAQENDGSEGEY